MRDRHTIQSHFQGQLTLTTWISASPTERLRALLPSTARWSFEDWFWESSSRHQRCDIYQTCVSGMPDFTRLSDHDILDEINRSILCGRLLVIAQEHSSMERGYDLGEEKSATKEESTRLSHVDPSSQSSTSDRGVKLENEIPTKREIAARSVERKDASDGQQATAIHRERKLRLSKDVVIIAWINPRQVTLSTNNVSTGVLDYYPVQGVIEDPIQKGLTVMHLGWIGALGAIHLNLACQTEH